jgi:type II secretory pathway pseudopilin PulG
VNFPAHRSAKAFTLIEVMLAATFMLAGIVGAIQVLVSGSEMLETSRKQAAALQIIDSELARVRMSNLSDWSLNPLKNPPEKIPAALPNTNSNGVTIDLNSRYPASSYNTDFRTLIQKFTCTRTVGFAMNRTDYKQVTIKVTWTNHNGRTYTRTGTTYVGKNGLYVSYQR